ncbi:MAG: peptidoglycan recognition family protein [Pseudomonadota bacterium]
MNKFLYLFVSVLIVLVIIFSYKTRNYRLDFFPEFTQSTSTGAETKKLVIDVVSKPVTFDSQRKFLTSLYREKHTGDCDHEKNGLDSCVIIKPQIIILHMTDLETLAASYDYMKEPVLKEEREKLLSRSYDRVNVSSHFMIDRDGTIYSLMPENYMARSAMGVNHLALAIENVGMNYSGPTREQIDSDVKLVKYLMDKYKISAGNIYSHADVNKLKDTKSLFFVEKETDYFMPKYCGEKVLKEVKRRLGV